MGNLSFIDALTVFVFGLVAVVAAHPDVLGDVARFSAGAVVAFAGVVGYGSWRQRRRRVR